MKNAPGEMPQIKHIIKWRHCSSANFIVFFAEWMLHDNPKLILPKVQQSDGNFINQLEVAITSFH